MLLSLKSLIRHKRFSIRTNRLKRNCFRPSLGANSFVIAVPRKYQRLFTTESNNLESDPYTCFKCHLNSPHPLYVCQNCHTLQKHGGSTESSVPNGPTDMFSFFGLKEDYNIDTELLSKRYKELQRRIHPDLQTDASESLKKGYERQSASIYDIYRTLKDDYLRALYMLERRGITFNEDFNIGGLGTEESNQEANAMLLEIFEIREQIDCIDNTQEMNQLLTENKKLINECTQTLSEAFSTNNLGEASKKTMLLKFLVKIDEEGQNKLFELKKTN